MCPALAMVLHAHLCISVIKRYVRYDNGGNVCVDKEVATARFVPRAQCNTEFREKRQREVELAVGMILGEDPLRKCVVQCLSCQKNELWHETGGLSEILKYLTENTISISLFKSIVGDRTSAKPAALYTTLSTTPVGHSWTHLRFKLFVFFFQPRNGLSVILSQIGKL